MALQYPTLDAAIGKAEGFGVPGAIPTLGNNPGDLIVSPFSTSHGATGSLTAANGQQIATFPDTATGTAAMDALIASNYAGGTITDLSQSWLSGSAPQTQQNWANTVASTLGVPVSTPVSQTGGGSSPTDAQLNAALAAGKTGTGAWASAQKLADTLDTFFGTGISWGRIAAFLGGLIFIAGGIFLLKPVQGPGPTLGGQIIRTGKRGAAALAVTG